MHISFRKAPLLCALLIFSIASVACDSGGSNDESSPEWTGNWEIRDYGGGQGEPVDPTYWTITGDSLKVTEVISGSGTCSTPAYGVVDERGNTVTYRGASGEVEGDLVEMSFEVNRDTLTVTVLEDPQGEAEGNQLTLTALNASPKEVANCE